MKVLMIGAGDIARSHARAVVKLGGSIVGAYDVNAEGLKSFAKEFDCDQLSYEQIPEYVERADYAVISHPAHQEARLLRDGPLPARAALP